MIRSYSAPLASVPWRPMANVPAAESDDGLAGGLVEAIGRGSAGHGAGLLSPGNPVVVPGFPGRVNRTAHRR